MTAIHKEPYKRTLQEAEQRGEEGTFWESYNDDCYCKMAIDEAIRRNCFEGQLSAGGIMRVVREYGLDRVERLLANKIRQDGRDGGFSRENREWARTVPIPESVFNGYELWKELVLSSDSRFVDETTDVVRKERAWQAEHGKEKKPSIRVQLAMPRAPAAAVNEEAKKYGREER